MGHPATGHGCLREAELGEFDCTYPTSLGPVLGFREVLRHSFQKWGSTVGDAGRQDLFRDPQVCGLLTLGHTDATGSHGRAENGIGAHKLEATSSLGPRVMGRLSLA